MRSFILYYLYIQHHVNPAGLILSMGIAWIEAKTDFYNIDLDQEDLLYDGDVQRMTGDSRSVGLVVSFDNSFYFVYICRYMFVYIYLKRKNIDK